MSGSPETPKPRRKRRKAESAPARSAAAISLGRVALRGKWATRKVDRNSLPIISGILGLLAMLLLIGSQWQVWRESLSEFAPLRAEQEPQAPPAPELTAQADLFTGDPTWDNASDETRDVFGETRFLRTAAKPPTPTSEIDYFTSDERPVPEPIEPDEDWFDADESFKAAHATVELKDEPMFDASEPFPEETMPPDDPFVLDIPQENPPAADPFGTNTDEGFRSNSDREVEPFLFTPAASPEVPPEAPPRFALEQEPAAHDVPGDPFGRSVAAPELELSIELPDARFTARSGESIPLSRDLLEQLAQAAMDRPDGWEIRQDRPVASVAPAEPLREETHLRARQLPVRTIVTAEDDEPAAEAAFSVLPIQREPVETAPAERSVALASAPAARLPAPPTTSTVVPQEVEQVPVRRIGVPAPQAAMPGIAIRVESPKTATAGEPFRFHFEVINTGRTRLEGVVLRVDLPGSLQNSYGDRLQYRVGTLEPGERHRARLTVDPREAGTVEVPIEVLSRGDARDALSRRVQIVPPTTPRSAKRPSEPVRDALCLPLLTSPVVR